MIFAYMDNNNYFDMKTNQFWIGWFFCAHKATEIAIYKKTIDMSQEDNFYMKT